MRLILVVPTSFKGRKRDALKHAKAKSRQLKLSQRKKIFFAKTFAKMGLLVAMALFLPCCRYFHSHFGWCWRWWVPLLAEYSSTHSLIFEGERQNATISKRVGI